MARKSRQSFLKRQRERTRVEKAALKRARRQARRESPDATGTGGLGEPEGGLPPGERDPQRDFDRCPDRLAIFSLTRPFYMPNGEVRVHDPDGYCLLIGQLSE